MLSTLLDALLNVCMLEQLTESTLPHKGTTHLLNKTSPFCFPKEHFRLDLWIRKCNLVSQDNRENSTIINDAPSLIQRLLCSGTPLQYFCLEKPMDGGAWWAAVHGVAKSRARMSDFTFTFHFHALEKEMATHASVFAWRIPGTGEPGGLPSMGSHRVGHDWSDLAAACSIEHWYLWGDENSWLI